MYFKELEIKNFRNYEYCRESFNPGINFIIGENGQGKTSLAEALYIMCLGRSFRTLKDKEMISFGKDQSVVRSVVRKNERNIKTEIILNRFDKKNIRINGLRKKNSDLSDNILIVVFSPEDLKIVKEDPDKRRRFINREMSQINPAYYEYLVRYTRILNQRNYLLKTENTNISYLNVWNEELAIYGAKIIYERNRFIKKLNKISSRIHKDITDGLEELLIEYDCSIEKNPDYFEKQEIIKNAFYEVLTNNTKLDILKRTTGYGPHRDDIKIYVNGKDVRKFGSQGQQRTAALSLKLAEIKLIEEESGETPVLILDDVLSELDRQRQDYLINSLNNIQVFLTSTDIRNEITDKFEEKNFFIIKEGKVIKKL